MKRTFISLVAAAAVAGAIAAPASAQRWQNINQRQENLYNRIEQGVRNGALTRNEAQRLRARFVNIERLERRYRASNGLQAWERRDLNTRFDALSRAVYVNKHDGQHNRYR